MQVSAVNKIEQNCDSRGGSESRQALAILELAVNDNAISIVMGNANMHMIQE